MDHLALVITAMYWRTRTSSSQAGDWATDNKSCYMCINGTYVIKAVNTYAATSVGDNLVE